MCISLLSALAIPPCFLHHLSERPSLNSVFTSSTDPCVCSKNGDLHSDEECSLQDIHSWLLQSAAVKEYVSMYHASLTSSIKASIQLKFQTQDKLCCVVATIAFGMVHMFEYSVPKIVQQLVYCRGLTSVILS